MKPKAIWLVAGGALQANAAARIKEHGYRLIVSDGSEHAHCRPLADEFVHVDTFDSEGHVRAAARVSERMTIAGVLTAGADCHTTVACLAEHLRLPGLPPSISHACRNKALTRRLLTDAGLPQPWSKTASTFEEAEGILQDARRKAEGAVVLKATDNSGSRGFRVLAPGEPLTREQFAYTQRMGTTGLVVLEEQLQADRTQVSELSVETIWQDGKMYWFNWVDRIFHRDLPLFPILEPHYRVLDGIEIGHINPAHHAPAVKHAIADAMFRAGRALRLHEVGGAHVLKGDIFLTPSGPVILELTPRCSGGWDSSASSPARGADLVGGLVQLAVGRRLDLDLWHAHFAFRDAEVTAVVLTTIPEQAADCLGREYALASGVAPLETLMADALLKRQRGEYLVPVC